MQSAPEGNCFTPASKCVLAEKPKVRGNNDKTYEQASKSRLSRGLPRSYSGADSSSLLPPQEANTGLLGDPGLAHWKNVRSLNGTSE
jgi:hypothetical protein